MRRNVQPEILGEQDAHADEFGRARKPIGAPFDLLDDVPGQIHMLLVIGIPSVEDSIPALPFGFEMVQENFLAYH
ncbi:hypothetical protein AB0J47_40720 [Nocardia sp. NPDC049737]|uniref:Uncharacterized protein n=1 Tax=Nocardia vinacea TaxID=96468 RepID=A0ABZ1YLW6_9NOCA|nr:hypothetical protein [Nocardia vinacea]